VSEAYRRKPESSTHPAPDVCVSTQVNVMDEDGNVSAFETRLEYYKSNPFEVSMIFRTDKGPVPWKFARELLADGMYELVGDGDIHIWPENDNKGRAYIMIELNSPDGTAYVQAPARSIHTFVNMAEAAVPISQESSSAIVDQTIAIFLASEEQ
jgi:hypothetical protein